MFDTLFDDIEKGEYSECYPPKPDWKGSFKYHVGSETMWFIQTFVQFLGKHKPADSDEEIPIIRRYGLVFTIQYVWIDNDWKIRCSAVYRIPGVKPRNAKMFKIRETEKV